MTDNVRKLLPYVPLYPRRCRGSTTTNQRGEKGYLPAEQRSELALSVGILRTPLGAWTLPLVPHMRSQVRHALH